MNSAYQYKYKMTIYITLYYYTGKYQHTSYTWTGNLYTNNIGINLFIVLSKL